MFVFSILNMRKAETPLSCPPANPSISSHTLGDENLYTNRQIFTRYGPKTEFFEDALAMTHPRIS